MEHLERTNEIPLSQMMMPYQIGILQQIESDLKFVNHFKRFRADSEKTIIQNGLIDIVV